MTGKLSLVATPIGNLEDITLRAIRVLREADVIYAEDTRHSSHLLTAHQIHKPLKSCHDFSEEKRGQEIVSRIQNGQKIAFISDAGTPGISDPGYRLVHACIENKLPIEVIPGACAAIAALSISGLPTHEFHFAGFLPPKSGAREKRLRELSSIPATLIFYESPYRVIKTLEQIALIFPDRMVVVAREITKKFEEFCRGTSVEVLAHFQKHSPKGEFVILISNL
jgi:16S rRNA (cytidine1402-2'-O)-methyltransferase